MNFSKIMIFILFLCFGTTLAQDAPNGKVRGKPDFELVYIKFRPGVQRSQRFALHAKNGQKIEREVPQIDMHVVKVPPGKTAEEVCKRYEKHPHVEFCEIAVQPELQLTPNDPWFPNWQIALQQLGAEAAWELTTGAPIAPVATVDTGLDYNHYEFMDRVDRGEITGAAFGREDWLDTNGHGTLVAGIVAALGNNGVGIAGAAWDAPLMALNALSGYGRTAEAIIWAADNGARVINMSYGSYTAAGELAAVQYAYDKGVVLVAAAGNDDTDAKFYPAAYDLVIAVTGIAGSGTACGMGHGDWIDLAAPCSAFTTYRTGTSRNGVSSAGGTSIASPFVAAAAALVISFNPQLTPEQVRNVLRTTADDVGDPGFDSLFGYGRVNYHRAVLEAFNYEPIDDVIPPVVEIVSPIDGAIISGMSTVRVEANDDTRVARVDLYIDSEFLSGDTVSPHDWTIDTLALADGNHLLLAVAIDSSGNESESVVVSVYVDNTAPFVSFISPENDSTVQGEVTISVEAKDSQLEQLTLKLDGETLFNIGSDGLVNLSTNGTTLWDTTTVENGIHILEAIAVDKADNTSISTISVNVDNQVEENGPEVQLEIFNGSVKQNNSSEIFRVRTSGSGELEITINFSGGPNNQIRCVILDSQGQIEATKVSVSPLEMTHYVESMKTFDIMIERVEKNANFTLEVLHP